MPAASTSAPSPPPGAPCSLTMPAACRGPATSNAFPNLGSCVQYLICFRAETYDAGRCGATTFKYAPPSAPPAGAANWTIHEQEAFHAVSGTGGNLSFVNSAVQNCYTTCEAYTADGQSAHCLPPPSPPPMPPPAPPPTPPPPSTRSPMPPPFPPPCPPPPSPPPPFP